MLQREEIDGSRLSIWSRIPGVDLRQAIRAFSTTNRRVPNTIVRLFRFAGDTALHPYQLLSRFLCAEIRFLSKIEERYVNDATRRSVSEH